ncbi:MULTISPECIES: PaaI family thioesterase [Nocardia]|uniref:PaaI family thioesterase n=1 Tax=Nocardia TaxID=1817 RepID=UPI001300BD53|nr:MULTISPECIES: PaaI family thioesterase [Nocardia]
MTSWSVDPVGQACVAAGACPADWHAGPGTAFGGWTAAVFDDVLGRTVFALGERPRTASLHIDYRRPVPVETPLVVRAGIVGHDGRRRLVSAEMYLESTGEVVAAAEATMVVVGSGTTGTARAAGARPDFIGRHIALRRTVRDADRARPTADLTHEPTWRHE